MAPRNEPTSSRAEPTGRDLLEYVVGLTLGVLVWVVESYGATSTLVFDPTWTAVGVATGLALFALTTFWDPGRRFQRRFRESTPFFVAVMAATIVVVLWLGAEVGWDARPAHYSWFLGLGLSQLPGIGHYLRQRSVG